MGKKYPFPTPLPVIVGAYFVRLLGTAGGKPVGNDLCWQTTATGARPPALTVANQVALHWIANIMPILNAEYTAVSCGVYDLSTAGSAKQETPMAGNGGILGAPCAVQLSALVKHNVNVRKKVGKTNLSPMTFSQTTPDGGSLGPGHVTEIQTAWNAFIAAVNGDAMWAGTVPQFSVLSKITAKAWDPRTLAVSSSVVEPALASQNRRRQR